MASPRRTFVLGTGAQKAGTTWLSRYLDSSPEYDSGYRKEYHVFDSIDLPSEAWMRARVVRLARESVEAVEQGRQADAEVLHRLAMVADPAFYYDYFAGLTQRGDGVHATGDITPDYAMLSAERMTDIRDELAARGVHTVAVFLMRDPVERIWSHIRMKAHRRPAQFDTTLDQVLVREHAEHAYACRTRYEQTLDTLGRVFAPEDVHVGLYETLFADQQQARTIARLVGIDPPRPRLGQKRNASPRPDGGLPEEVTRPVAEHFAETYREVARRRPDLDVARWWPHSRHVL